MISPHKNAASPRTSVPLRGLFVDGQWFCNCHQRLPAAKRQTKYTDNRGRWYYTCQLDMHKRCNFFLWASDAEAREKLAVISNSSSEPFATPQAPSKQSRNNVYQTGLLTPQTERPTRTAPAAKLETPSKSAKARMMSEDADEFKWDDTVDMDDDDALGKLLSQPTPRHLDFGRPASGTGIGDGTSTATVSFASDHPSPSPHKEARTDIFTSPGKRKLAQMQDPPVASLTPTSIFSSGARSNRFPPSSADISSTPTPSKYRNALSTDTGEPSELALQAVKIWESHGAVVPRRAQEELTMLLNRQDLKTKGISRGRDISRIALKKKDEEIMRLKEVIRGLEAQRELDRNVIAGLNGR
ncbi:hypothetical protein FE257_000441 [Aspergillus nanangensis]|uniref:GRF-type domain-containing protein n=1 Tax=Aspergillus nanangensis TaxID=2582783 RepID=A0AAD4CUT5_ASPNN|nr:hypothetical protein FE257_000441 [Aspergillus nanangensis]